MLNSATALIRIQPRRLPMQNMYWVGLDVHKKTISYCVKDASGRIHLEGTIPAARIDLDRWMKILPQPWMAFTEAIVFCRLDLRSPVTHPATGLLHRVQCSTLLNTVTATAS
jgi:hypothetical protein